MSLLENAIAVELAKLARVCINIDNAVAHGLISDADGEERKARLEQQYLNRCAYLSGEKRPRQRENEPLEKPDAGRVG